MPAFPRSKATRTSRAARSAFPARVAAILKRFRDDKFKADGTNNCSSTVPAAASYANGTANPAPARIPSLMIAADFANYRAIERKPLVSTAFGATIY